MRVWRNPHIPTSWGGTNYGKVFKILESFCVTLKCPDATTVTKASIAGRYAGFGFRMPESVMGLAFRQFLPQRCNSHAVFRHRHFRLVCNKTLPLQNLIFHFRGWQFQKNRLRYKCGWGNPIDKPRPHDSSLTIE